MVWPVGLCTGGYHRYFFWPGRGINILFSLHGIDWLEINRVNVCSC